MPPQIYNLFSNIKYIFTYKLDHSPALYQLKTAHLAVRKDTSALEVKLQIPQAPHTSLSSRPSQITLCVSS